MDRIQFVSAVTPGSDNGGGGGRYARFTGVKLAPGNGAHSEYEEGGVSKRQALKMQSSRDFVKKKNGGLGNKKEKKRKRREKEKASTGNVRSCHS